MNTNEVLQDIILNMPIVDRIHDHGFDISHPNQEWYCVAYPVTPEQLDNMVDHSVWVVECFDHGKFYAGKWSENKESAIIYMAQCWAKKFGQISYSWIDQIIEIGDLVLADNGYGFVVGNDVQGIYIQYGENYILAPHDDVDLAVNQNMLAYMSA